jgi:hypothetical protein
MATKDWKQYRNNKNSFGFEKKKAKLNEIAHIQAHEYVLKNNSTKWLVAMGNSISQILDKNTKTFKTKPQALKYAKAYMRKN